MPIRPNPVRLIKSSLALLCGIVLAVCLVATPPANARSCAEMTVAMKAGKAFLRAARTKRPSDFAAALSNYADMRRISLFALGRYRRNLPANQVDNFVRLTSRYVANTLADFARKFRATAIKPIDCRGNKIATRLEFGARPAKRATWRIAGGKVVDINVQNVWLAQLLRDNFVGILKKSGGDMGVLFSHIGASPPSNSN